MGKRITDNQILGELGETSVKKLVLETGFIYEHRGRLDGDFHAHLSCIKKLIVRLYQNIEVGADVSTKRRHVFHLLNAESIHAVFAAVELVQIIQIVLYHSNPVWSHWLAFKSPFPRLPMHQVIPLRQKIVNLVVYLLQERLFLVRHARELAPLFEPLDLVAKGLWRVLIEQTLNRRFTDAVYEQKHLELDSPTFSEKFAESFVHLINAGVFRPLLTAASPPRPFR
jgi:hypothetical protein